MPSILVTGASRGLGYAFVTYFASQPDTTVFGIARNSKSTNDRLAKEGVKNVTIIEGDITNFKHMQQAADQVSKATGGKLDLLINNAAFVSEITGFKDLTTFEPEVLEKDLTSSFHVNVVGVAHTVNAFLPLVRKGDWKKVITISTGLADDVLTNKYSLGMAAPYAASKAAVNTLVAKYNAALGKSDGILFLAVSPGVVDTVEGKQYTEEEMAGMQAMGASLATYAPDFKGPTTPEQSVKMVVDVIEKATVETQGGDFVSHYGNKTWL